MEHAGLIFDSSIHYLDHLGPFCAQLGWPLIVCDGKTAELARCYPDLEVVEADPFNLRIPPRLALCDPKALFEAAFPFAGVKNILWLPHGNSDKGWKRPFFEALQDETILAYGQKMIDFISEKKGPSPFLRIGNFRWNYFLKHKPFYLKKLAKIGLPPRKNFLYAPTWEDGEQNGTFWNAFPRLAEALPSDCHLLVKLHPNTERRYASEIEILKGKYEKRPNLIFLPEFPPIYPLLSLCDAYIGDQSSIGYDFLKFNRPMYFIDLKKETPDARSRFLYQCGTAVGLNALHLPFDLREPEDRSEIRKKVYDYTFDAFDLHKVLKEAETDRSTQQEKTISGSPGSRNQDLKLGPVSSAKFSWN